MCSTVVEKTIPEAAAELGHAAGALIDAVDAEGLADYPHDELAELMAGLRSVIDRVESTYLQCVRRVDASGSYSADGALSAAAWLRWRLRLTGAAARDAVQTARELDTRLPALAEALAAGSVSVASVHAVARGVKDASDADVAALEPIALRAAEVLPPADVSKVIARFRYCLDQDQGAEAALRRHERQGLSYSATYDGMVAVSGLLDEVTGATFIAAVDAHSAPTAGDTRSAAQRRAAALGEICRRALDSGSVPRVGGVHPHVVLTVDEATLRRISGAANADLARVGPISSDTARRVSCDADVTLVGVDARGKPVNLGRQRRFFTAEQRRAIVVRDGGECPWPGCDLPSEWSDGHHRVHWGDNGATSVDNGLLPCRRHHTLLHEGGWQLERDGDGRWYAQHRKGRIVAPEPKPHDRAPLPRPGDRVPLPRPHDRAPP